MPKEKMNSPSMTPQEPRRRKIIQVCIVLVLVMVFAVGAKYIAPLIAVTGSLIARQGPLAIIVYIAISALGVVLLPLSSIPLLPIAAAAWGVVLGGLLSILGWWIGAMVAFLIGRHLGRPVICRFISEEKLAHWETKIPKHAGFFAVVLMRLVLPVEIPSYLLGLTKAVGLKTYAVASLLGMSPFAFVLLAMGGAVAEGDWIRLSLIGMGAALGFYALYLLYRRFHR
ncbi:MAG: VTT domain-containing protein [Spirochaetaceae bacterium]|nr:VTT domain-containing protein [Spirochaetaceae bacterium]